MELDSFQDTGATAEKDVFTGWSKPCVCVCVRGDMCVYVVHMLACTESMNVYKLGPVPCSGASWADSKNKGNKMTLLLLLFLPPKIGSLDSLTLISPGC